MKLDRKSWEMIGWGALLVVLLIVFWWIRKNRAANSTTGAAGTTGASGSNGMGEGGFPVSPWYYTGGPTFYTTLPDTNLNITPDTQLVNFLSQQYFPLFGFVGVGGGYQPMMTPTSGNS